MAADVGIVFIRADNHRGRVPTDQAFDAALESAVTAAVPRLSPVACAGYTTLLQGSIGYLIVDGRLWGFGLFPTGSSPCRSRLTR